MYVDNLIQIIVNTNQNSYSKTFFNFHDSSQTFFNFHDSSHENVYTLIYLYKMHLYLQFKLRLKNQLITVHLNVRIQSPAFTFIFTKLESL